MRPGARTPFLRWTVLIGVLALVLAACGGAASDDSAADTAGDATPAQDDTTTTGGGDATEAADVDREPVELSLISSFPRDALEHEGFWLYVERLQERAPWIEFDYRGGPDVMGPLEQIEGIGGGAVQAGTLPDAYYVQQAPVAELMKFSPYLPWEARENGVFDLYQQFHEEQLNVHLVGFVFAGVPFLLFSGDELPNADWSGKTIRTSSAQAPIAQGLGAEVVNMPAAEVFTALERGTVDGFGWASVGVKGFGWHELVGHVYSPRFYEATIAVVINNEVWDGLDEETQTALEETMIEVEREVVELYNQLEAEEYEAYDAAGVEQVAYEGEDAQKILEAAYVDGWDAVGYEDIVQTTPIAEDLRELFEQGYGENFQDAVPGGIRPVTE